jgi:tRNA(fMet)-specific endonuclease VapC
VGALFLLDTNILVHYVRGDRVWRLIQSRYSLLIRDPSPIISVVTIGELKSLAQRLRRGLRRLLNVDFILGYFDALTIDDERVYDAYATIETYTRTIGRPMGKNDLWIAATTYVAGATILTTDHDFDHRAPQFLAVDWIDPTIPPGRTP